MLPSDPIPDEWADLRVFEDGPLAHDVATAILAMEYDCLLFDMSEGRSILGAGSEVDPDSPQAHPPLKLIPGMDLSVGPAFEPTESPSDSDHRRTSGGPWVLRVPVDQHAELSDVLDAIIEERDTFEVRVTTRNTFRLRIMQAAFLAFGLLLLFHLFRVVMSGIN